MQEPAQDLRDEELARGAQAGQIGCFELIVVRHQDRLYRFLLRRTGNAEDAADLAQAAFVKAYRNIARFDPARRFDAWLLTIAHRLAVSHYRHGARRAERSVGSLDDQVAAGSDPARQAVERDEEDHAWRTARRELPHAQFSALWLRYGEDMTVADIARVMGRTQTSVKVLLHRGRVLLIECLNNEDRFRAAEAGSAGKAPTPGGLREAGHVVRTVPMGHLAIPR